MVMCDYCGNFYHTECIGIDSCSIMTINTYKCQLCLIDGNTDPLYEEGSIYFRHPKNTFTS